MSIASGQVDRTSTTLATREMCRLFLELNRSPGGLSQCSMGDIEVPCRRLPAARPPRTALTGMAFPEARGPQEGIRFSPTHGSSGRHTWDIYAGNKERPLCAVSGARS